MVNSLPVMNNKSLILKIFPFIFRLYWRIDFKTVTEIYLLLTFKKKKHQLVSSEAECETRIKSSPGQFSIIKDTQGHQVACLASMSK